VDSSDIADPFAQRSVSAPVARESLNVPASGDRRMRGHQTSKSFVRAASRVCAP
jgi:hypothetical protein